MTNKLLKAFMLLTVIAAFTVMALGSGSSDPAKENKDTLTSSSEGENKSDVSEEKAEFTVGDTEVSIRKDSIGSDWIKVVVPVTNTGSADLYLSSCGIDIEDSEGKLVETLSMVSVYPQVIKPGETAYYYEETTYDGTTKEGLKVVPHVKAEKAKVDPIRFEVSDLQIKDDDLFGAKVMGRVKNTTEKDESMVYVVANLFDKDGKFIGLMYTILTDSLTAGDTIGFEMNSLSTELKASDIATYDVIAYPLQMQL